MGFVVNVLNMKLIDFSQKISLHHLVQLMSVYYAGACKGVNSFNFPLKMETCLELRYKRIMTTRYLLSTCYTFMRSETNVILIYVQTARLE